MAEIISKNKIFSPYDVHWLQNRRENDAIIRPLEERINQKIEHTRNPSVISCYKS